MNVISQSLPFSCSTNCWPACRCCGRLKRTHARHADCIGPYRQGTDFHVRYYGLFISTPERFHTFTMNMPDPGVASFNYTSESTQLQSCIAPGANYPSAQYRNRGRLFVYPGEANFGDGVRRDYCWVQEWPIPFRGCPTRYGWRFETDTRNSGNYDMSVRFDE
jgi:hypothetical protein